MEKRGDYGYRADKGKHFVLTEKGKTWASYRDCEVGQPIDEDDTYASAPMVEEGVLIEVDDPDYITCKGYKAVYNHNGYELNAGNGNAIFHSREMAERQAEAFNNRPWRLDSDEKAYVVETIYEGKRPKPCREYNGKIVYNEDWWFGDIGRIGDLVEWKIADYAGQCVPPASYGNNFIQCGEPYSSRLDDNTGKYRSTYSTFKRIAEDVWMYCGNCFRGEDVERGAEPVYVAG